MTAPTLTEFLLARIAEDEARPHDEWCSSSQWKSLACDCSRGRLLAECEAKRRIVEIHYNGAPETYDERCSPCDTVNEPCGTLLALAAVYSDHPDYREEWTP